MDLRSRPDMAEESAFSGEIGHRTITAADLVLFGTMTGDYARMHFDHGLAAAENGSPGPIVHGLLFASWALGALAWSAPARLASEDPNAAIAGYAIRLERSMRVGDRFSLRHRPARSAAVEGLASEPDRDTEFEVLNQRGERTARGSVSVRLEADRAVRPAPMARPAPVVSGGAGPLYAAALLERGPRGESVGRTVSEADVVGFTNWSADRSPLYLNRELADRGRFGERIVPPMWTFCLAFGDFLRDLLAVELPSTGLAGHLGDSFRCWAPVRIGDTIRTRHRPVRCTPSRSRPDMSVVHFALELLNQRDELVQAGEVAMWIPARAAGS
ncbi:MAG: MaoC family dehydratase N-terminal domain-containing protein [Deltaproteobacteria bacterium]|nr:MaoC family dehydratase N-terminal domain-containing protein [Deltaproteobacteria bacterium]